MHFIISVFFLPVPVLLFLLVCLDAECTLSSLIHNKKCIFSFICITVSSIFIPMIIGNSKAIFNGTATYHDLEIINYCLLFNTVFAIVLGFIARRKEYRLRGKSIGSILLVCVLIIMKSFISIDYAYESNKNIVISEVCRKQMTEYLDDNGDEVQDKVTYITISNPNDYACYYEVLYLSTNNNNLTANISHNITIPKKGSYTITYNYGCFDISDSKDTEFFLSSSKYNGILDCLTVPALQDNEAYSFDSDSNEWNIIQVYSDSLSEKVFVEKPEFDHEGGFYDSAFDLYINVPDGTTVYYTTDSSNPTAESAQYTGNPIYIYDRSSEENIYRNIPNVIADRNSFKTPDTVEKCFVLRAVAIDKNGNMSDINTQSFFINLNKYKQQDVISLVTDPDNLFNEQTGIYVTGQEWDTFYNTYYEQITEAIENNNTGIKLVWNNLKNISKFIPDITELPSQNYNKSGMEYEREANLQYFTNGDNYLNQAVGIRIQGNSARWGQLKRFSIYSRKKYSRSAYFDEPIFGSSKSHSVFLRQGFQNMLCMELAEDIDIDTLRAKSVTVFLDGEFWYQTYLYEKYNEKNIAAKYNLFEDNIEISKAKMPNEIVQIEKNEELSANEKYEALSEIMDIQSYINYYCFNLYMGNEDINDNNNYVMWKTKVKENAEEGNGLWRWALYDMDLIHGYKKGISGKKELRDEQNWTYSYMVNTFIVSSITDNPDKDGALIHQPLYKCLRQSDCFCERFVVSFMDLVNTTFEIHHVEDKLKNLGKKLSYEDSFFIYRADYITEYMAEEFALQGTKEAVIINTNDTRAGVITLNTIKDISKYAIDGTFTGHYYTDYPIELSVTSNSGYRFEHWEVNGEYYSSDLSISLNPAEGGLDIYAVFD